MEIFTLTVLSRTDVRSLYGFLARIGLSTAIVSPALRRLTEQRFITAQEPSSRAVLYRITEMGERALKTQWSSLLEEKVPPDAETILRGAWVVLVMGGPAPAAEYLRRAAQQRQEVALQRFSQAGQIRATADGYLGARSFVAASRRLAESEALLSLAQDLERGAPSEGRS